MIKQRKVEFCYNFITTIIVLIVICKKNYGIRTNTIFFQTHKSIELWQEYIELFSQGLALRKIVEKLNNKISLPTAFYWRHKILKVLTKKDDNDKLGGTIEADEAFF